MSVSPSHLDTGDVLLTIKAAPDVFEHGPAYADPHLMMVIVQESNDAIYGGPSTVSSRSGTGQRTLSGSSGLPSDVSSR